MEVLVKKDLGIVVDVPRVPWRLSRWGANVDEIRGGGGGRCPRGDHDERTNDVDQMKKADISEIHGQE